MLFMSIGCGRAALGRSLMCGRSFTDQQPSSLPDTEKPTDLATTGLFVVWSSLLPVFGVASGADH
jgi:hypothetical protein